jgi:hypothetical protein
LEDATTGNVIVKACVGIAQKKFWQNLFGNGKNNNDLAFVFLHS